MDIINIKAYTKDSSQVESIKAFMKSLKIKFEVANDPNYNPEFVVKIEKSRKQAKEGKTVKVSLDEIWK